MARRSWSASAGVKPAATMAIFIACSWNSGTPSVLPSTSSSSARGIDDVFEPLPAPQIGMHHVALDGAGPHDRDLDDEIVEFRAASAAAASTSAPGSRSGTRRSCRRARSWRRRQASSRQGSTPACDARRNAARGGRSRLRKADSMPSASTSILRMPSASRSSLSHSTVVRSVHGGVGDRHHLVEPRAGDDEAAGVLRQMARETRELVGEAQHLRRGAARRDRARCGASRSESMPLDQ